MFSQSEFLGKAYLENAIEGFSLGHWVSDISGDRVKPHGHHEAHIMFITGGHFVSGAVGESSSKYPLMIYNPPDTYHSDRFVSKTGSFFTISLGSDLFEEFYEARLPNVPTAVADPVPHSIINKLMREFVEGGTNSLLTIESFCFEMIGALGEYPVEKQAPKWLKNAFEILQDSFTCPSKISVRRSASIRYI
jgi:hypothetical protein